MRKEFHEVQAVLCLRGRDEVKKLNKRWKFSAIQDVLVFSPLTSLSPWNIKKQQRKWNAKSRQQNFSKRSKKEKPQRHGVSHIYVTDVSTMSFFFMCFWECENLCIWSFRFQWVRFMAVYQRVVFFSSSASAQRFTLCFRCHCLTVSCYVVPQVLSYLMSGCFLGCFPRSHERLGQLRAGALLGGSVGVSSLNASDWRSAEKNTFTLP